MRAVQVLAPGRAEFVDTPIPELKPGHALVRTRQLSLCGSDVHMLHYAPAEHYPFPPGTSGHEMVGVVEAVDAPGSGIEVGNVALTLAPGHCAMAEYYLAPVEHVLPLPPGKPSEQLLQAQQLGTVIYACKRLPNVLGLDVAVIGQGSAGLWFDVMLRRMGARRVMGLDLQEHRLAAAHLYGATHTINARTSDPIQAVKEILGGDLPDVVVEAAGEEDAIKMAVGLARAQGDVLFFGVPRMQYVTFDYRALFFKYLRMISVCDASSETNQASTRQALDLIASGQIDVAPVLTHTFPFDQVMDAYELQRTPNEGAIKIVVEMPS